MGFRRLIYFVSGLYRMYFRPPNADIALARKDSMTKLYLLSAFLLFVYAQYGLFSSMMDPKQASHFKPRVEEGKMIHRYDFELATGTVKKYQYIAGGPDDPDAEKNSNKS